MLSYLGRTMMVKNWMVCQFLIIISTPLQGKITKPVCGSGSITNIVFEVEDFYFWRVCNYKSQGDAKTFCSNAGGWLHEPRTETIVEYMKTSVNLENGPFYRQGLEKVGDTWTWLQGGEWDNQTPQRKDPDNGGETCSVHANLVWQQRACEGIENRYICQFQSCRVDEDCNQNEDCVTIEYNNTMKFCTCKGGYSGTRCGAYCDSNDKQCLNGGTCKDLTVSPFYECDCVGGFYGQICANNYCDENGIPCQNGGTCQADTTNADYKCMCEPGYYGTTCANNYCDEFENPCQNGGTCQADTSKNPYYKCMCEPGYYGTNCTNNYCEFHPGTCKNGGSCTSTLGSEDYNCDCPPEYTGKNCENELFYKDGDCMYYINKNEVYEYEDAKEQCLNYGGALSMVKNDSIQSFLQSKFADMYRDTGFDAWVGGEKDDSWKWMDNEIIGFNGYDNWATDEPSGNGESVLMRRNNDESKWYGVAKSHKNVGIICEKPDVENWPCLPNNNPCQNGKCTAIGCQATCTCSAGYFQRYCDEELITIQSDEERIGVENENLTLSLEVTTFDGRLTIHVMKDGTKESTLVDVDNGTVDYLIVSVQQSDNGSTYTFIAYPQSGLYNRSASAKVIVHVRAYVNELETTSLHAPQSAACTKNVTCTVGGTPSPIEYGWYRNGCKLSESEDAGVHQTIDGLQSTLSVQNAIVGDEGEYECYAENIVAYDRNVSFAESSVTLSVYSAPVDLIPVATPCSEVGEIKVDWDADSSTYDIAHRFSISQVNGTDSYRANKSAYNGEQVIFDGLCPYTTYTIHVEVCPESECCIAKLNKTTKSTTGHGLPGEVPSTMNGEGTTVCVISWNAAETPIDQVEGYNISWTATVNDELSYGVDDIEGGDYVEAPQMNYNLQTKPNKIYQVKVSARTCAGNGIFIEATGQCWTPIEGPDEIPAPLIDTEVANVRQQTREIVVQMVNDESNGPISCLFVILYKDNEGNLPQSLSDLQQLSSNAGAKKVEGGYIAVAINRGEVEIGDTIHVTLGNESATGCNAALRDVTSREQTDSSSFIEAKNIPLDYRGVEYSVLTVTTSPDSGGNIIVSYNQSYTEIGDLPKFTQGTSLVWVTACVLIPIIIIAVAVFAWMRYKRNTLEKKSGESSTFTTSHLDDIGDDSYETIDPTTIPLKRLKEYYLQMEANECMLFREQFVKLKQEAKKVAPLSTYAGSAEVMMKNRFKNILPYDNNRVYLRGEGPAAYINASYIKGSKTTFIATQGPLPNTIADFWRMIVEQGVKVIVMLTKCEENGKRKCEMYWPAAKKEAYYGSYRIMNINEKMCGGIMTTVLKIYVPEQSEITVTHYHYVRWPDHGVPQTTTTFFRLHKQVMTQFQNTDPKTPIVVHCSAGVGRTGTFIGFDVLLGESDRGMNVYKCVMEMRQQRVDMVQTSDQYQMLHKLMMERQYFMETDFDRNDLLKKKKNWNESQELTLLNLFDAMHPKWRQNSPPNSSNVVIVRQPEDTEWVRIDATFVEAYQDKVYFIASAGPSNSTVEYFLRALWDNFVDYVIMLNKPSEEALDNHGQFCDYWPTQLNSPVTYNSITITRQSEQAARGWVERTFYLERRNQPARTIRHYQYLHWESDHAPEKPDLLLDLIQHIIGQCSNDGATVLVHCTNGLGRTGVFIALANIITRLQLENRIDVVRTVKDLKDIRPGIVQTLGDYKCCYEMARQFSTQVNVHSNLAFQDKPTENEEPIYQNVGGT